MYAQHQIDGHVKLGSNKLLWDETPIASTLDVWNLGFRFDHQKGINEASTLLVLSDQHFCGAF